MVYKFRQRTKISLKTRLFWAVMMTVAFTVGGIVSVILLLHINHAFGLNGPKKSTNAPIVKPNSKSANSRLANTGSVTSTSSKSINSTQKEDAQGLRITECGITNLLHVNLSTSSVPQLKKLAEYEKVCNGGLASTVSFFAGTPTTSAEASEQASWVAEVLKEFSRKGITPLVFFEPASGNGILDLKAYKNGVYDGIINEYFASLRSRGVTDSMMGTWVPMPEGNIPVWGDVDPDDFSANVTKTVQIQKSYFPGSKAAVMLQSMTYPTNGSWANGSYKSLLPFVQSIPKGLINSFGLQGFAWPPTTPDDTAQLDPSVFLRVDFAAEAAHSLGVNNIWLNTGTYNRSYVVSRSSPYTLTSEQRQVVLNGIVQQVGILNGQGFTTAVHLFAEDKSLTDEAIDWSYWPAGLPDSSAGTYVFKTFVHDLKSIGTELWLYDSV